MELSYIIESNLKIIQSYKKILKKINKIEESLLKKIKDIEEDKQNIKQIVEISNNNYNIISKNCI